MFTRRQIPVAAGNEEMWMKFCVISLGYKASTTFDIIPIHITEVISLVYFAQPSRYEMNHRWPTILSLKKPLNLKVPVGSM